MRTGGSYECHRFFFDTYSEIDAEFTQVEGRFYRTLEVPAGEKAPLLLISPILGGAYDNYLACRVFSRWACAEGISAFFLHQEENILSGDRDGVELERLTRGSIRDNIRTLDLFLRRADVDPRRVGSFGISLGAIKNVVLMAVEPRLSANVLCMGGADLGKILLLSRERGVLRYLQQRGAREALTPEEICAEVSRNYKAEPGRFAEALANDRVLLFLGSLDNKVPYETGKHLREKLGGPETYIIPLGHYTGILAAPFAAGRMFRFLNRRFEM
jgi:dienelactone hydrolase